MGAVKKIFSSPKKQEVPDYDAQRRAEEERAAEKKKSLLNKGRSGTMLGGSIGDNSNLKKTKLGS